MAALNLILVCFLELKDGQLLSAALFNDLAGHGRLGGIAAGQNLLVVGVYAQNRAKLYLFAHFARYAFHTNSVAGSDTILLSPGLDYGVHHSSRAKDKRQLYEFGGRSVNAFSSRPLRLYEDLASSWILDSPPQVRKIRLALRQLHAGTE